MRLLVDTHVLLWWLADERELLPQARDAISTADAVYVSSVSAWEIEIKRGLGKVEAPDDIPDQLLRHRFSELPLRIAHARHLAALPNHHRDPFDRMLIAQAREEGLTIVTRDAKIAAYDVETLAA